MKFYVIVMLSACAFVANARFSAFDELQPRPRKIEAASGVCRAPENIKVEVNGSVIPPPIWGRPGFDLKIVHPEEPTSTFISELPFTNEEYWMREPTKVSLRKGWNHVKITLPHAVDLYNYQWVGTFMPVSGTSARPREVEGLEYSSDPR